MHLQPYSLHLHAREACRDLVYGVHSEFPWCCVYAYACDVLAGVERIAQHRWDSHGSLWAQVCRDRRWWSIGYVPCSRCLTGIYAGTQTPVQGHDCEPECERIAFEILRLLPFGADVL